MQKNVLSVIGTRPEVIKMAPVIKAIERSPFFNSLVCTTSQHREMQDEMIHLFDLSVDADLNIMKANQTLQQITTSILSKFDAVLKQYKPDLVIVHGDTTTSFSAALTAFYNHIPIAHIEAGLRTYDIHHPYPEEANRQLTSKLASIHFAPTEQAKQNLLQEGISQHKVWITGNTVVDSLLWMQKQLTLDQKKTTLPKKIINITQENFPFVLITGHRRENFGQGFQSMCQGIAQLAKLKPNWHFIYPVHLNPNVKEIVHSQLSNIRNVHLIEPISYENFVYLLSHCKLVLTDSGGIQEEAPSLGKPALVMREKTERPEGISAGTTKLVGTKADEIVQQTLNLINNPEDYKKMANAVNPYGIGNTSQKICQILQEVFQKHRHFSF